MQRAQLQWRGRFIEKHRISLVTQKRQQQLDGMKIDGQDVDKRCSVVQPKERMNSELHNLIIIACCTHIFVLLSMIIYHKCKWDAHSSLAYRLVQRRQQAFGEQCIAMQNTARHTLFGYELFSYVTRDSESQENRYFVVAEVKIAAFVVNGYKSHIFIGWNLHHWQRYNVSSSIIITSSGSVSSMHATVLGVVAV